MYQNLGILINYCQSPCALRNNPYTASIQYVIRPQVGCFHLRIILSIIIHPLIHSPLQARLLPPSHFTSQSSHNMNVNPLCLGSISTLVQGLHSSAALEGQLQGPAYLHVEPTVIRVYVRDPRHQQAGQLGVPLSGVALGRLPKHVTSGLRFLLGFEAKTMPTGPAGGWRPHTQTPLSDSKGWVDCKLTTATTSTASAAVAFNLDICMFSFPQHVRGAIEALLIQRVHVEAPAEYLPTQHYGLMAFTHHDTVGLPTAASLPPTLTLPSDLAARLAAIPSECDLPPADPGPMLKSTLQPHQARGLAFLLDRERPDCEAARLLWVYRTIAPHITVYTHQITHCEVVVSPTLPDQPPRLPAPPAPPPSCQGSILADDMGLGKTVQSISLIASTLAAAKNYKETAQASHGSLLPSLATLIVCPLGLLDTWRAEILKHTHPALQILLYYGPDKNQFTDAEFQNAHVVLTTYGTVQTSFHRTPPGRVRAIRWFRIILDEAQ